MRTNVCIGSFSEVLHKNFECLFITNIETYISDCKRPLCGGKRHFN